MFLPTVPLPESTPFSPTDAFGPDGSDSSTEPSHAYRFSSTLSPSLISDLNRFADEPGSIELLPAMAASVRHGRPLAMELENERGAFRLSVFPRQQLFHSPVDLLGLPLSKFALLKLVGVESENMLTPFEEDGRRVGTLHFAPLSPLMWLLAEHGERAKLLPEIAGPASYRMAPGFEFRDLPIVPSAMPLLQRLRAGPSSLEDLSDWTVRGSARVCRLLNALYLQSGLIVSRVLASGTR
jgi:hypothetical protein